MEQKSFFKYSKNSLRTKKIRITVEWVFAKRISMVEQKS